MKTKPKDSESDDIFAIRCFLNNRRQKTEFLTNDGSCHFARLADYLASVLDSISTLIIVKDPEWIIGEDHYAIRFFLNNRRKKITTLNGEEAINFRDACLHLVTFLRQPA